MDNTSQKYLDSIERKINLILSENKALRDKIQFYDSEMDQIRGALEEERERAKNLENQIKINNIAKGNIEGEENVKMMRAKINEVIRDVDKCIRYLKN